MSERRYLGSLLPRPTLLAAAVLTLAGLAACGREQHPPTPPPKPPLPPPQTGVASYYGREFTGRTTASGETHKPGAMTAASRTLPLGAVATVTNTETGKSVNVKVNDRGPYAKHRIIDVSRKAAKRLGMKKDGVADVKVQPLPVGPLDPAKPH